MRMKSRPFDIGILVYDKNRDLLGFHIVLTPESLYKPGILHNILEVLKYYEISVLHITVSRPTRNKPIDLIIFADFTDKMHIKDKVYREIKRVDDVKDVVIVEPVIKGLVGCSTTFPIYLLGERCIIIRKAGYKAFIRSLEERYGTALFTVLFDLGFAMGIEYFKDHIKFIGDNQDALLKLLCMLAPLVGFGKADIVKFDPVNEEITIRVYDSFECELFIGNNKPSSHFIRGMLSGWFSNLLNKRVVFKEVKCIAMGDPYCEFIVIK